MSREHRGTIFAEDAEVLVSQALGAGQFLLRLRAPRIAAAAAPGAFVHVRCDERLAMRRPMSLMRVDPDAGWVEVLFKAVGTGTALLATRRAGDRISLLGPIGEVFHRHEERPLALLIGGGVGIPPMVFLAERLRAATPPARPLVLMGSEIPFPFRARPSSIMVPGMPEGAIAGMPLLEDWGIPSRLASGRGYAGCFDGYVTDLARHWIGSLNSSAVGDVEVFACGPTPMLEAAAKLAAEHEVPCQVSLEEYMACAVGGCAGCTLKVRTAHGPAMKRVCVDGPVFDAADVLWTG